MENSNERRIINPYDFHQGGFMPNCLMEARCISAAAKVCYLALASFAGKGKDTCWPSQEKLADRYGSAKRSTQEHLKELVDHGFIRIKQNGLRQSNTYEFFSLENWEDPLSGVAENRHSGMADSATPEARDSALPEARDSALPIKEPLSYEPLPKPLLDGVAENATQNPERQPSELDLGDPLARDDRGGGGFLRNAYSRLGRPRPKFHRRDPLLDRLYKAEEKYGPEEFRQALLRYLSDDSDWLKQNNWPIGKFLKDLERDLAAPHVPRQSTLFADTCPTLDTSPPPTQAPSEKQRLIALWNSGVPQRAFTDPERHLTLHPEHSELSQKLDSLIRKASAIVQATPDSTWLTLRWLCSDKDGYPNWRKLLSGALDFKASQRGRGGGTAFSPEAIDRYYADKKAKREMEEKAKELMTNVDLSANRF